jgi:anti-sigma-K factor RskA
LELKNIISSGLLELFVSGLTSPEETRNVEKWMRQYPEVKQELKEIEDAIASFAQANAVLPSAVVKEKLMASINNNTTTSRVVNIREDVKKGTGSFYWKWAAAASILLLFGSLVINMVYYNKYSNASKNLKETEQLLAEEKQHNNQMSDEMGWVQNPNSMPVVLKEMDPAMDTKAKIFWMQNTGEIMVDASHLPEAPTGMQYQFWGIVDGKPVNGGMIRAKNGETYHMQKMKSFGRAEAFAISLEKAGGNPTPTKVVSMGKII